MNLDRSRPVNRDADTARIETFSDGVFAIAITLLVLEIRVPKIEEGSSLFEALFGLWPSYLLAYALSFLVIGTMWANHHNRFRYIARSDHVLLFVNTLLLMFMAFIPFPTALLAEYGLGSTDDRTAAAVLYSGTLAVTAVFFTLLWLYAATNRRLVDRDLSPHLLRAMTRRYVFGVLLYAVAFALAFVAPSQASPSSRAWPCSSSCPSRMNADTPMTPATRTENRRPRMLSPPRGHAKVRSVSWARQRPSPRASRVPPRGRTSRRRCGGSGRGSWLAVSGARS